MDDGRQTTDDESTLGLVLASSSPRRIELLRHLVPNFLAFASPVEDTGSDLLPWDWEIEPLPLPSAYQIPLDAHPTLWAWRKAVDVAMRHPDIDAGSVILGADTIVIGPGTLLGKPAGPERAADMLRTLRGIKHYVATGFAMVGTASPIPRTFRTGYVLSEVWMRDYTDDELEGYVATGEPLDKAGAYAVQGLGGKLVDRIEGCYNNVVGLPLCAVRQALDGAEARVLPYPEGGYCEHCPYRQEAVHSQLRP